MGDPGLHGKVGFERGAVPGESGADDGGAHGRAVAGGVNAAACGRNTDPQAENGAQGRTADADWHAQEPPPEAHGQTPRKEFGVVGVQEQRLSDKDGVIGVVADRAAAEKESVPPAARVELADSFAREPLGRIAKRVADGSAQDQALEAIATLLRQIPLSAEGLIPRPSRLRARAPGRPPGPRRRFRGRRRRRGAARRRGPSRRCRRP